MNSPQFDGVVVRIGNKELVVPPLNFKILRKIQPKLQQLTTVGQVPDDEQIDSILEVVHLAVSRNYPEMTREELEELVDLGNLPAIIGAIMGVSGLEKRMGEAQGL